AGEDRYGDQGGHDGANPPVLHRCPPSREWVECCVTFEVCSRGHHHHNASAMAVSPSTAAICAVVPNPWAPDCHADWVSRLTTSGNETSPLVAMKIIPTAMSSAPVSKDVVWNVRPAKEKVRPRAELRIPVRCHSRTRTSSGVIMPAA